MTRILPVFVRAMALTMVFLVAAPASGLGQFLYFCTMSGEVGPKCCCAHRAQGDRSQVATVSAPGCCELVGVDRLVQTPRVEVSPQEVEAPELLVLPPRPDTQQARKRASGLAFCQSPRGPPPRTGPPIFIENCAFLI
jgi:hypothetical protein